jgi:hypothetical protein
MEIKQTVLPPYGGSREEMGGGASAWTYGRGVIGSPGAAPTTFTFTPGNGYSSSIFPVRNQSDAGRFTLNDSNSQINSIWETVPDTFENTDWNASVYYEAGLVGTYPISRASGSPGSFFPDPDANLSWMSPLYGTPPYFIVEYRITSIIFDTSAKTVAITIIDPPYSTTSWFTLGQEVGSNFGLLSASYPNPDPEWSAVVNNPTGYKLVIAGSTGTEATPEGFDGEYLITTASIENDDRNACVTLTLGQGFDVQGTAGGAGTIQGMNVFRPNPNQIVGGTASIVLR